MPWLSRLVGTQVPVAVFLLCCLAAAPPRLSAEPADPRASGFPPPSPVELLRHELVLRVNPEDHRMQVQDRMTLRLLTAHQGRLSFALNPALQLTEVALVQPGSRTVLSPAVKRTGGDKADEGVLQEIAVSLDQPPGSSVTLEWVYEGRLNDPPRESRQLRFVTPSETAGHIGPDGVYLSGETHWYPDVSGALPIFTVQVDLPAGWEAVTHGKQVARESRDGRNLSRWEIQEHTEALTLVANRFVHARRDWRDPDGRVVEVSAYLFPEDAALATEYLEATETYLNAYTKLLGPYPFPKFAVVENFFASGLGMPSFTLLGSGVVKRHYVQPYALGHEIVHSWIGNWVLNHPDRGNWVEGLTTYLANYYYEELSGPPERAREQRRLMLLGYAVHVWPEEEYPVGRFRRKTSQKDNAIGYQKAAMIFHLLRREVGEEAFWTGLRRLVSDYGGRYAEWGDVEKVFGLVSGRSLRWFFAQWVERAGAPILTVTQARARPEASSDQPHRYIVTAKVIQEGGPYRLRLPLGVLLADGHVHDAWVEVQGADETVAIAVPGRPVALRLDPAYDSFRRLPREQVPPMLNLYVTDRKRILVKPEDGVEAQDSPYLALARQVAERDPAIVQAEAGGPVPEQGSVLFLGGASREAGRSLLREACGDAASIEPARFSLNGKVFDEPGMAVLLSCRRPGQPGSVVSVFHGVTPQAAAKVARLLFFYGWHSYVVFRDGTVVTRGDLAAEKEEVPIEAS